LLESLNYLTSFNNAKSSKSIYYLKKKVNRTILNKSSDIKSNFNSYSSLLDKSENLISPKDSPFFKKKDIVIKPININVKGSKDPKKCLKQTSFYSGKSSLIINESFSLNLPRQNKYFQTLTNTFKEIPDIKNQNISFKSTTLNSTGKNMIKRHIKNLISSY